jgi:hypothetical protein
MSNTRALVAALRIESTPAIHTMSEQHSRENMKGAYRLRSRTSLLVCSDQVAAQTSDEAIPASLVSPAAAQAVLPCCPPSRAHHQVQSAHQPSTERPGVEHLAQAVVAANATFCKVTPRCSYRARCRFPARDRYRHASAAVPFRRDKASSSRYMRT